MAGEAALRRVAEGVQDVGAAAGDAPGGAGLTGFLVVDPGAVGGDVGAGAAGRRDLSAAARDPDDVDPSGGTAIEQCAQVGAADQRGFDQGDDDPRERDRGVSAGLGIGCLQAGVQFGQQHGDEVTGGGAAACDVGGAQGAERAARVGQVVQPVGDVVIDCGDGGEREVGW